MEAACGGHIVAFEAGIPPLQTYLLGGGGFNRVLDEMGGDVIGVTAYKKGMLGGGILCLWVIMVLALL